MDGVTAAFVMNEETTQKYRQDLDELKKQFAPMDVTIGKEE